MKPTLSERVSMVLKETGFSQAKLAKLADVSRARVNQWLSSKPSESMSPDAAFKLEDNTEYSARWLATGDGPIKKPVRDPRESSIVEIFRACDERGKTTLLRAAESESRYLIEGDDEQRCA